MTKYAESNTSLPSANWEWRKVKMSAHPQGTTQRPAGAPPKSRKRRRALGRPTQVTITYVGGPEANFVVCFEKRCWRYPGHWCLFDVMNHVAATIAAQ